MTAPRKQPVGRFYELQQEVSVPDPYVLTSKIKIPAPTKEQMKDLRAAENEEAAERAILGDSTDDVLELYKGRPNQEWEAFIKDLNKHFFGPGVNDVEGKSSPSSE